MSAPDAPHAPVESAAKIAAAEALREPGAGVIKAALPTLPVGPGVYRMLDPAGEPLYVGKAKSLVKRVTSYASPGRLSPRIQRMVAETAQLEVITTHTEVEALLLESNLIKRLKPRYNVLWRDDKSFPYILITGDHDWPQITKHRGARNRKGEYFGPFASAGSVNRTINALQRAFPLRSCSDSVFTNRTRPCLQFQIKRCTAPCVGRIGRDDYDAMVKEANEFLSGRSRAVQDSMSQRMEQAAAGLDFERAALFRDRIRALAHIQAHQGINPETVEEADVIALHQEGGQVCVQVFFFRAGQNWGNRAYFPTQTRDLGVDELIAAFLGQFYDDKRPPKLILLSHEAESQALIAEALSVKADRKVQIHVPARGEKRDLVEHALNNAREALGRRLAESAAQRKLLEGVAERFGLDGVPDRIEVYDNSHIAGTHALGVMIVAGPNGFVKNAYRKFNIKSAETKPGDDYAMMDEVLRRRFTPLVESGDKGENWPDLVLIDGGPGQLAVAQAVLADLGITDVTLAGIAKGPERDAGREHFYMAGRAPFMLEPRDPVLYFLQRLRDEAHRFAIGSHRGRRSAAIGKSLLDEIPGIGAKRKRALLTHFGSAKGVAGAGLNDLEAVEGISGTVAKLIYDHFHPER
jgi:excinuclease ABC subunit C